MGKLINARTAQASCFFELKSRSGKVRFAKGLELRLANRKERQEFSSHPA